MVQTLREACDMVCDYCPLAYCYDECPIHEVLKYHCDIADTKFEEV